MKTDKSFLDRLLEHWDKLDSGQLQDYIFKLAREKGVLETVFNTIQEGVVVLDESRRIHYMNVAARRLLSLPKEAVGEHFDVYMPDINSSILGNSGEDGWDKMGLHEIEVFSPEHRILTFYVVPHSSPEEEQQDAQASNSMATLIFRDVTREHEDREQLVETQRVKAITELAAGVAHEVGNPLNSLHIHLQLLSRKLSALSNESSDVTDLQEYLDVSLQEVDRLDSIVNNFLRAIRPNPPELEPLQIQHIIEEALHFMRREIEDRDIHAEARFPDQLPNIPGDPDQLKQAFYNIIKNSMKAMQDGGKLTIDCSVSENYIDISFADTGSGISRDELGNVMEPFFSTRSSGTGLGLIIVERIIRDHGGELSIQSKENQGTTVTIRLPLHERHFRLLQAPQEQEKHADSNTESNQSGDSSDGV